MSAEKNPTTRASGKTSLTHVRVFDGQRLCEPGTVVIDGEVIATDPAGARVIDCDGGRAAARAD